MIKAWLVKDETNLSFSSRGSDLSMSNLTEATLSPPQRAYSMWRQYNNSKLLINVVVKYFQERWGKEGITFYAAHPGNMVPTGISRYWWVWRLLFNLGRPFTKTLGQGAATSVYCATAPELAGRGGLYWNNCWISEPGKPSHDPEFGQMLIPLLQKMIQSKVSGNIYWD